MPFPRAVTQLNKKYLNRALVHVAGHGWFVELEHVGRRSGRTFRVPIMAFDRGDVVTVALTYGRGVDTTRMREMLGFTPAFTTAEAFADFGSLLPPTGGRSERLLAGLARALPPVDESVPQIFGVEHG